MDPRMCKAEKELQGQGRPDYHFRKTPQESEDENGMERDLYAVQHILSSKKVEERIFYQIKWEGYDSSQNTWEPIENLTGSLGLLEQFWQQSLIKCRRQLNRQIRSKGKSRQLPSKRKLGTTNRSKVEQESSLQKKEFKDKEAILIEQPQSVSSMSRKSSESDQHCRPRQIKAQGPHICSQLKNECFSLKIEDGNRKGKKSVHTGDLSQSQMI